MSNLDIFIKTYHKDFKWLFFCLFSIDKFVDGFQNIVIAIPNKDKHLFTIDTKQFSRIHNRIKYIYTDDYGDTYLYQQYIKMIAYKYSDADSIMFVDSDIVFKEKTNISDFFIENKPIIYYAPYKYVGAAICWKRPTSDFIGEEQIYEFMRRNCLIYFRNTLIEIHEKYPNLEKMIMDSKVGFSEFNAIGAWAFKNHSNIYEFINVKEIAPSPPKHIQFWSPTNINEKDLKQIREILYDNN
jgi:hypothetical protein